MATRRVRDLILRITGDPGDAEKALHDLAREVDAFGRMKAEATVDVNTAPAERAMADLKKDVVDFGKLTESAKIDLQTAGAQAQLDRLQQRLAALGKRESSPKIDIQIGKTIADIERVELKLAALGRRKVEVKVDVDRRGGAIGALGAGVTGLGAIASAAARGVGVLTTAVTAGIGTLGGFGRATASVITSLGVLGPALLVVIPLILGFAASIGIALVAALGALVASLLAAAAAVGVLATAFVAALGPIAIVAVAAFARLAKVLDAVKESEEKAADQARRVRDAQQAQRTAATSLAAAQENLTRTATEGYRAWADAIEAVDDAQRSLLHAQLGVEQARLNERKAKQELADFRKEAGLAGEEFDNLFKKFTDVDFTPKDLVGAIGASPLGATGADPLELAQLLLNVKDSHLGVADAIDAEEGAQSTLNETNQTAAEFAEKGIAAYQPYVTALAGVTRAQNAYNAAVVRTTDTRKDQTKALKELNPQEQRLAKVLGDLKKTFTNLLAPATNRVFDGVIDFLRDLEAFGRNRQVRKALTEIGGAIGGVFRTLGRELRRKETREAFVEIAAGATRLIRALGGQGLRNAFRLFLRLGREAMPILVDKLESVVKWFGRLVDKTADSRRLRNIIGDLVDHFDTWWGLAKQVARVVGSFLSAAKDDGRKLARDISKVVEHYADLLAQDPTALQKFFSDAVVKVERLATAIERVASAIEKITSGPDLIGKYAGKAYNALDLGGEKQQEKFNTAEQRRMIENLKKRAAGGNPFARQALHNLGVPGYRRGGPVAGTGYGDSQIIAAEPGEYVIRRSVAQAIGLPKLDLLNAGQVALAGGTTGMTIQEQHLHLPAAPGHDQLGDPRVQAVLLARELRRRGGGGFA